MSTPRILALAVVAALITVATHAHAASGVVTGKVQLWEKNGGYCPAGRNCSGSNYPVSQTLSYQPIANAIVNVYMTSGSTQVSIGTGTTSSSGIFTMSWSYAGTPGQARIVFRGYHKDGRFTTYNSQGATYLWQSQPFTLTNGTTTASPQSVAPTQFGTSTSPDPALNLWAAAETTWWYGMMGSNKLFTDFTNIALRGVYTSTDPNDCQTCGSGPGKYLRIHQGFDFDLPTVAHEMGHIASYLLNVRRTVGDYCYGVQACTPADPFCCNSGGGLGVHQQDSAEWQQVGFEEGFASVIATVALNQQFAPDPHFCTQVEGVPCANIARNRMEPSKASVGSCPLQESRQENSATRYLWDIYDSVDDPEYVDNVSVLYWNIYNVITRFPDGFALRQDNDAFNGASPLGFDNRDGFNGQAFQQRSVGAPGFPSSEIQVMTLYDHNCGIDLFGFDI